MNSEGSETQMRRKKSIADDRAPTSFYACPMLSDSELSGADDDFEITPVGC